MVLKREGLLMNWAYVHIALRRIRVIGVFVIAAAVTISVFLTGEAAENELKIHVEEFKEIFHVQNPSEAIPGLGYAVSLKLAKSLEEQKWISVIRDRKKDPDITISGTVTLDTREDPKRIMITIELKGKDRKTLKTHTFTHRFEKYPAFLERDSDHLSSILRSLHEKRRK